MSQVEDVGFPVVANPGDDKKGFTAWMDMANHPGSRIMDGETVVEKHEWAEKGVTGGAFRWSPPTLRTSGPGWPPLRCWRPTPGWWP